MTSISFNLHPPPPLNLPDFDDDDAFDSNDDNLTSIPYAFSPDAIREEMARNMPDLNDNWADEREQVTVSNGGSFGETNTSVSTLDIGFAADPQVEPSQSPPPKSPSESSLSLSANFSQISLTTPSTEVPPNGSVITESESGRTNGNGGIPSTPNISQSIRSTSPSSPPPSHSRPSSPLSEEDIVPATATVQLPPPPLSSHVLQSPLSDAPPLQSPPPSAPSPHTPDVTTPPATQPSSVPVSPASASSSSSMPTISTIIASNPPSNGLTEKPAGHRPHRSMGPSMFEKVRSKTRPTFLPPKPRQEDEKHMADWQQMMKQSRAAAEKRRKAFQERRVAREKAIEDSLHVWEKEIVPDWRVVHKNPAMRRLWWQGIPTKLRATLWEKAVGNGLALSKDHYRSCLARANRALSSGVFPKATMELIEQDIDTTLPAIHIFHRETGPLYGELKEMLMAWVVARSDEGLGYTLGAAKIAAMFLINMPAQQGFNVMRNLLERHLMRSFFGGERSRDDASVEAYYRIFDTLLADSMPKIYFNFKQHQISPSEYLPEWIVPLFLDHLPFEACARVWDVLLLEGDSFLYRAAVGILAVLEPRLFFPDRKELLELLKGENKAAIEVAKREGRPLNGGKYEIYGVDEETLWDRIDSMDDWWKDNTWIRLIRRELPDL
ncbi:hypothetical protein CVT24_005336 [Panaeolus cyanescens]|uniref:Rab-GAP TBC domain-containing protein n=1 Tax=Panaeolus cyanescens TaxID=181874 RepID=A0A409Y999_9AGAR|nr:hypothetical protein CVT24_005336 [Panaeolus cyanescens]